MKKMESLEEIRKVVDMVNVSNKYFEQINILRLQIEHHEQQRQNTWNLQEREQLSLYIKEKLVLIDDYLDQYNFNLKTGLPTLTKDSL